MHARVLTLSIFAAVLVPAPIFTVPLRAQAVSGAQIAGFVSDPSGANVAGALVTATQTATNAVRTTRTDSNGAYTIPNLPLGPYNVEVSASGFSTYLQSGILLSVGNDVTINVGLTIGNAQQQVRVTANASMVEAHDTSVSQVIDEKRVLDLPLNGRQVSTLIVLSGGAANATSVGDLVSTKNYGSTNISATAATSIAGGQGNGTNYLMDGGDNNDPFSAVAAPFPFPDAVQEFAVQTAGLSARYGVHPAGVVNIITKSGSNQYHGDLFEFIRNGDLNARNFFATAADPLKRNQFGGTVGGPVKRDRLFFFFGYQGTRIRTAPPQTLSHVETAAVLNGDFSTLESGACQSTGKAKAITNPATGVVFPGSQVPVSLFNPQALALLKYVPASTNPCGSVIYGIPNPQDENQYLSRADWTVSAKQTIYFRHFWTGLNNPAPAFGNNLLNTSRAGALDQSQSGIVSDTYTFSPTAVNTSHISLMRQVVNRTNAANNINPQTVGIDVSIAANNFTQMSISNYFAIGCGSCANYHAAHTGAQLADDFDWIHGRHHISFGANLIRTVVESDNIFTANGSWTFSGVSSGDALLDFMLGRPSAFTQGNPSVLSQRQFYIGAYVQDDFQVNPRLQVHFGLRWEPFLPSSDIYGRGYEFSPQNFAAGITSKVYLNAPPGLLYIGDAGVPSHYANNRYADFMPRAGFAWDTNGNGRQTIRGSYGISYDSPNLNFAAGEAKATPWGNSISLSSPANGLTNPYSAYPGGNPFPSPVPGPNVPFPTAGTFLEVPPNIRPTYVQQWSVNYQLQLKANWLLTANYIGNKTTHLWASTEADPAVYIPGTCNGAACSTTSNTAQRRVLYLENPKTGVYYSTIAKSDDGANSEYEGLLASAQHRFANNYTLLANYTYSHCISEGYQGGDLTGPQYQNPYQRDRANCPFDIRQIFNLSIVAQSPHFKDTWKRLLLNNWQLAPLATARSGLWFTPLTGVDNSLTGVGLDRPNVSGNPYNQNLSGGTITWLNPAAFTANAKGTFGDAGAYSLHGPGNFDVDIALTRSFTLHRESQRLDVRFEVFNLFNRVNFSNPSATLSSAQFGTITAAGDPRILSLAMKLHF
jgi:hypothetical protein